MSDNLTSFLERLHKDLDLIAKDPEKARQLSEADREGNPVTLGPRVVRAEDWVEDMVTGATAKSKKWLDKSLRPKKDPKAEAIAANEKYKNKMRTVIDEDLWVGGIQAYDEGVREEIIKSVGTSGFEQGIRTHKPKALQKIKKLQPMVTALAEEIDKMPEATDAEREAKMLAARRGMIEIGKRMKGKA